MINILINLLENPFAPRYYRELKDYYIKIGKIAEAEAFDYLLKQRYNNSDDSLQREDSPKSD